jgi:hypothetical protein
MGARSTAWETDGIELLGPDGRMIASRKYIHVSTLVRV